MLIKMHCSIKCPSGLVFLENLKQFSGQKKCLKNDFLNQLITIHGVFPLFTFEEYKESVTEKITMNSIRNTYWVHVDVWSMGLAHMWLSHSRWELAGMSPGAPGVLPAFDRCISFQR